MELNRVKTIDGGIPIRNVLISVADRTGADVLAKNLVRLNPEITIYSTGGTFMFLQTSLGASAAKNLKQVSDYTGQPELQGGLVKTLDYKIYLGLLSETYNESHAADMRRTGALPFDLVVVNLYPFKEAVSVTGCTPEDARTHIDIGGPCMLRAAAKNYLRVTSVCSPDDYERIVRDLESNSCKMPFETRFELAVKTFTYIAGYDAWIAEYLQSLSVQAARNVYTSIKECLP